MRSRERLEGAAGHAPIPVIRRHADGEGDHDAGGAEQGRPALQGNRDDRGNDAGGGEERGRIALGGPAAERLDRGQRRRVEGERVEGERGEGDEERQTREAEGGCSVEPPVRDAPLRKDEEREEHERNQIEGVPLERLVGLAGGDQPGLKRHQDEEQPGHHAERAPGRSAVPDCVTKPTTAPGTTRRPAPKGRSAAVHAVQRSVSTSG